MRRADRVFQVLPTKGHLGQVAIFPISNVEGSSYGPVLAEGKEMVMHGES